MKLPRHAEIWLPNYLIGRSTRLFSPAPKRVWLAITDHYEPFYRNTDEDVARRRVGLWKQRWPEIAGRHRDSAGRPPRHTFFYPQEEYRPDILDTLAQLVQTGIADVEVHIHHDGEGRQNFIDRMSGFIETLHERHGLLHDSGGQRLFGFIHGNWALDNSLPNGRWCGLNDELRILKEMGCDADFTMPSGASPTQARMVNRIFWATDDVTAPKSYDRGIPLVAGGGIEGDLLLIPGPIGIRWRGRSLPRLETGEITGYDACSEYRVRRWLDLAPRIDGDVFIKLFTHGTQERNSSVLLNGGLDDVFRMTIAECRKRGAELYFVSAWEMWRAVESIRLGRPSDEILRGTPATVRSE